MGARPGAGGGCPGGCCAFCAMGVGGAFGLGMAARVVGAASRISVMFLAI